MLHARPIRVRSLENPREIIRVVTGDRWLYHGTRRFDFIQFNLRTVRGRPEKFALVKLGDEKETTNRMNAFGHSSRTEIASVPQTRTQLHRQIDPLLFGIWRYRVNRFCWWPHENRKRQSESSCGDEFRICTNSRIA